MSTWFLLIDQLSVSPAANDRRWIMQLRDEGDAMPSSIRMSFLVPTKVLARAAGLVKAACRWLTELRPV